ncbi:NACHT domain-containing protein [Fibrella aquatica]|uniref:NACHT domain-containing protein n=1 Tax=Fibrella aquatica TaxID=3242487 RepID=UPI003521AFD5
MNMDINLSSEEAQAMLEAGKYAIEPFISALLKSKVDSMSKWFKNKEKNKEISAELIEAKFRNYLTRSYIDFNKMNVLVFPNQQINIKSIYVPLSIRSSEKHMKSFLIDQFKEEYIKPYQKLLISDTAGMGKSTLTKWIALSLIEQNLSIPVVVELRHLKKKNSLLENILDQINGLNNTVDRDLVVKLLDSGHFTILLDGFDEIENKHKEVVIKDIKNFISRANENWYILTSRPESSLSAFGDFQSFEIESLTEAQSYELFRKYDQVSKLGISEKLIADIKSKKQAKDFLSNPFLSSLLYKTYTYNKDIPSKKSSFYDEVYNALYKHHDLSKDGYRRDKQSGLDIHDFRLILRRLAWESSKLTKVEFTEQELIRFVKSAKDKNSSLIFKEVNYIEDLESSVPLFVRLGTSLKWAHKSLQDYFAAEFIVNSVDRETIFSLIYKSSKDSYLNIIDFLHEQDYDLFRKTFIYPIICDYINYCDNSYKESAINIDTQDIRTRQALTFCLDAAIVKFNSGKEGQDQEDYDKYIDNILDKGFASDFSSATSAKVTNDTSVLLFYKYNFKRKLIDFLLKAGEQLFFNYKFKFNKEDSINLSIKFPKDRFIYIDDKKGNIINSKSNFLETNKAILRIYPRNQASVKLLDYDKCIIWKHNIENEMIINRVNLDLQGI